MIVEKAIQNARDGNLVNVAADDTDLLILLLYHDHDNMRAVYVMTQRKEPAAGNGSRLTVLRWEIGKLSSKQHQHYKKGRCNYNFRCKIYRRFIQKLNYRRKTFAYFMTKILSVFPLLFNRPKMEKLQLFVRK